MVDANDTSSLPHIMQCPKCGDIPRPDRSGSNTMRLICEPCGFYGLYAMTAERAISEWNNTCNEYMREKALADRQYELLLAAIGEEMAR